MLKGIYKGGGNKQPETREVLLCQLISPCNHFIAFYPIYLPHLYIHPSCIYLSSPPCNHGRNTARLVVVEAPALIPLVVVSPHREAIKGAAFSPLLSPTFSPLFSSRDSVELCVDWGLIVCELCFFVCRRWRRRRRRTRIGRRRRKP